MVDSQATQIRQRIRIYMYFAIGFFLGSLLYGYVGYTVAQEVRTSRVDMRFATTTFETTEQETLIKTLWQNQQDTNRRLDAIIRLLQ